LTIQSGPDDRRKRCIRIGRNKHLQLIGTTVWAAANSRSTSSSDAFESDFVKAGFKIMAGNNINMCIRIN
jgi:hypothetical protein